MNELMHDAWVEYRQAELCASAVDLSREDLREALDRMARSETDRSILVDLVTLGAEALANNPVSRKTIVTDNPPF